MRIKIIFSLKLVLCLLTICLTATVHASAAASGFPAEVSQGRGFYVSWPKKDLTRTDDRLVWQEREVPLLPSLSEDGGGHVVEALLGMPLDAQGKQALVLHLDGQSRTFTIEALPVPWKEQVLTVEPQYVEPPAEVQERIARESTTSRKLLNAMTPEKAWSLPLQRPVKGGVSSAFGGRRVFNGQPRAPHRGTDMRGPTGTPIHAVASGTVVLADNHYFSGNAVYIDHGQGVISLYAHLSSFDVKAGERVKKGQQIGKVGATGRVTGPHLHLGLMLQGVAVDAMPLFAPDLKPVGGPTSEDPVIK